MRYVIKWGINAVALVAAIYLIPGIHVEGSNAIVAVLITAAIFGVINIVVKPILTFLSCGCIVLTLGLFLFVINAFDLWFASWVSQNWFSTGFKVDGILPALFGSIVVSIVSWLLSMFVPNKKAKA